MLQKVMVGCYGNKFLKDCRAANRSVFLWTVNEEAWMRWSIGKKVDGVITDDPKKFLEVCDSYDETATPYQVPLKAYGSVLWFNFLVLTFGMLFQLKYGFRIDTSKLKKEIRDIHKVRETRLLA
jgi:phosphatidylglycerol phospholipase C